MSHFATTCHVALRALLSTFSLRSRRLREHLEPRLSRPTASGDDDGLLADLVFGPRAHFVVHDETLATLEDPKIDRRLLSSMNQNGPERFGRDWHPYRHQVQAWRALAQPEPRSVVVCSGTGSGKTD